MKKYFMMMLMSVTMISGLVGCTSEPASSNAVSDEPASAVEHIKDDVELSGELAYGTMALTFAEFWAGELDENVQTLSKTSDVKDSEGMLDSGMYDTVSRATTKHGIFRQQVAYTIKMTGAKITGEETIEFEGETKTTILTDDTDIKVLFADAEYLGIVVEDERESISLGETDDGYFMEASNRNTFELDGEEYLISDVQTIGFKDVPVAVPVEFVDALEGFQESATINASTYGLKIMDEDGVFGARDTSGMAQDTSVVADAEATTAVYNTSYGSDAEAYVYLKNADGSEMDFKKFTDYAVHFQTAIYEYYGDDDTYTNLVATYGSKPSADTWWSTSHGTRVDLGINYDFDRYQKSGEGFYRMTLISSKYADIVVDCEFKPAYEKEVSVRIKGTTIEITGIDESLIKGQTLTASTGGRNDKVTIADEEQLTGTTHTMTGEAVAGSSYSVAISLEDYQPFSFTVVAE